MPQNVAIDVNPVFGNGSVCEIDPGDGPSHQNVKGGVTRLPPPGPYSVSFQLPQGHQFDRQDPIWCSQGVCPQVATNDAQITNPVVDAAGNTLTVTVTPSAKGPQAVHVSLGFANGVRCDPIIIIG